MSVVHQVLEWRCDRTLIYLPSSIVPSLLDIWPVTLLRVGRSPDNNNPPPLAFKGGTTGKLSSRGSMAVHPA